MDEKWFVLINGTREGPYSLKELKSDPRITPDTLIWMEGFKDWIAIRYVPELKDLFKDEPESKPLHEQSSQPIPSDLISEQEALTLQNDPSQFYLWVLVIILTILYVFYQLNRFS
jgi:hypothetical protein